jgi:hypothetical protein
MQALTALDKGAHGRIGPNPDVFDCVPSQQRCGSVSNSAGVCTDAVAQPVKRLERVEHEHHRRCAASRQGGQQHVDSRSRNR